MEYTKALANSLAHAERQHQAALQQLALNADIATYSVDKTVEKLLCDLHTVAAHAEAVKVFKAAQHVPFANILPWSVQQLGLPLNDTWSGRGNELRRVQYEAHQEAVKQVLHFHSHCTAP